MRKAVVLAVAFAAGFGITYLLHRVGEAIDVLAAMGGEE